MTTMAGWTCQWMRLFLVLASWGASASSDLGAGTLNEQQGNNLGTWPSLSSDRAATVAGVSRPLHKPNCTASEDPKVADLEAHMHHCLEIEDVCVDQSVFILYGQKYQPDYAKVEPLPRYDPGVCYIWPNPKGIGDMYIAGACLPYPPVTFRANGSMEACEDLRNPHFDECTTPIFLWHSCLFNFWETTNTILGTVYSVYEEQWLQINPLFSVTTPGGMALPPAVRAHLQSLTAKAVASTAELSSRSHARCPTHPGAQHHDDAATVGPREPPGHPQGAAGGRGRHRGRCFRRAILCTAKDLKPDLDLARIKQDPARWGPFRYTPTKTYEAAQHFVQHSMDLVKQQEAAVSRHFAGVQPGSSIMRVVFVLRGAGNSTDRRLLNHGELVERCNAWRGSAQALNLQLLQLAREDARRFRYEAEESAFWLSPLKDQASRLAQLLRRQQGEGYFKAHGGQGGRRRLRDEAAPLVPLAPLQPLLQQLAARASVAQHQAGALCAELDRLTAQVMADVDALMTNKEMDPEAKAQEATRYLAPLTHAAQLSYQAKLLVDPLLQGVQAGWEAMVGITTRALRWSREELEAALGKEALPGDGADANASYAISQEEQEDTEDLLRALRELRDKEQHPYLAAGVPALKKDADLQFTSAVCVNHTFGANLYQDIALVRQADLLVLVHGAAITNTLFAQPYISVLEVRPCEPYFANAAIRSPLEMTHKVHWYAVDTFDMALCEEPEYARTMPPDKINDYVVSRDRSVRPPWQALEAAFNMVGYVGRQPRRYKAVYASNRMYYNERGQPMPVGYGEPSLPEVRWSSWEVPQEVQQ